MAWGVVGLLGNQGSTAGTTSMSLTTTIPASSGNFVVVTCAIANPTSIDTTTAVISGISDNAGNVWNKVQEFQAGGGGIGSGCICSVWCSHLENALSSGGTITATHNNAQASTRRTISAFGYSVAGSAAVRIYDTTYISATSAQSPLSIDLAGPASETLRFRAIASESSLTTALTTTAGWTNIGTTRAVLAAMSYRGEYLITSASTAASNPTFTSTATDASVYVIFEENTLMGTASL